MPLLLVLTFNILLLVRPRALNKSPVSLLGCTNHQTALLVDTISLLYYMVLYYAYLWYHKGTLFFMIDDDMMTN